ncbi:MAG: hypothetical protein LBL95_07385, partial [Deltaproteobacteria bacterium]|nr:hypothetical protein [Deltaproteobacteria bacterium]
MRYLALVLVLLAAAIPGPAQARPLAETGAPPGLAAWAPWVLYGQEERLCPGSQSLGGGCVWPISLRLDIGRDGGTFEGQWEIRAEKDVVLPGQPGAWPGEVTDSHDGAPASPLPVTGQSSPAARLAPGRHRISGSFSWQERPKTLTLPLGPIYDINLSGTSQGFPVLDEDPYSGTASLWLDDKARDAPAQAEEERPATVPGSPDGLTVRLDRLLIDTQPMTIITRARLTVSGSTREETIGGLLLPGSTPTALYSRIQSRLTAEGLRIQLSPGVHDVFVGARLDGEALEVGPVGPDHGQELWTFVQQPNLRQVEISGAPQIDVSMVDLPWGPAYPLGNLLDDDGRPLTLDLSGLPIYELQPGDGLSFQVLRRGDPEPGPDQLALGRECWLDFGGTGLSCRDQLDARMSRQWFLAVEPPFELGQA